MNTPSDSSSNQRRMGFGSPTTPYISSNAGLGPVVCSSPSYFNHCVCVKNLRIYLGLLRMTEPHLTNLRINYHTNKPLPSSLYLP